MTVAKPGVNDLATTHPELAAQLVDPSIATTLTAGSHKQAEWWCANSEAHPVPFVWVSQVKNRRQTGCPACAGQAVIQGWNDLATTHPVLTEHLVDPSIATTVMAGTNKTTRWVCYGRKEREHPRYEWDARIYHQKSGLRCPACAGQAAIQGWNDLATTHPELVAHLVDQSLATSLTAGRADRPLWHCEGTAATPHPRYEWAAAVYSLSRRENFTCPACVGQAVIVGWNDLATTHSGLVEELVDTSDGFRVTAGSNRRLLWRCNGGHRQHPPREWYATVSNRAQKEMGCSACAVYGFKGYAQGWVYRFRFRYGDRVGLCFGKTNKPRQRATTYRSVKAVRVDSPIEALLVGNGDDATARESQLLHLLSGHGVPVCKESGLTADGMKDEAFFVDEVSPQFLTEFEETWAELRASSFQMLEVQ